MKAAEKTGQILIECPNTIFYLYVNNEWELSKIEIFMKNIRTIKNVGLNDIYTWCNRQKIQYSTKFHYRREFSMWVNLKSFFLYSRQKRKYQPGLGTV